MMLLTVLPWTVLKGQQDAVLPDAPVKRVLDRDGLFDGNPEARKRMEYALMKLEAEHGYQLYVVIDRVFLGARARKHAADLQRKWLPDGGGLVLLYESDRLTFEYGMDPDMAKEVSEGRALVSPHEMMEVFRKSFFACRDVKDSRDFIEKFVLELCANFGESIEAKNEPVGGERLLRLVLLVAGAVAVLALFGLVLGMVVGTAGGKRRRVKHFPEVDVAERLGAPYGAAWASLKFGRPGDE